MMTNKTTVYVFDLDRTVIDSDHRVAAAMKPNGDLCLNTYRKGQTRENIFKDTLLPLYKVMRHLIETGEQVVICTARALTKADYLFLRKHCLKVPMICSRDQLPRRFGNAVAGKIWNMSDAEYKWQWCNWLKNWYKGATEFIMYDDLNTVLQKVQTLGFRTYNAIDVNELLETFLDIGYEMGYNDGIDSVMGSVTSIIEFERNEDLVA